MKNFLSKRKSKLEAGGCNKILLQRFLLHDSLFPHVPMAGTIRGICSGGNILPPAARFVKRALIV